MTKTVNIAVLGATGLVGRTMLEILAERDFPVGTLHALASARSQGQSVLFKHRPLLVEDAAMFDFSTVDLALFSAGGRASATYAPKAVEAGCVVIDNSSQFRYDDDVPLIIPEVNAGALRSPDDPHTLRHRLIANPNCSTIQMLVALKPLHDAAQIRRINVATYQSVSGSGQRGIDELATQTTALLSAQPIEPSAYPQQIAFNVIPLIDTLQENGYTREEMKMIWETRKIFEDHTIQVNPTAARVPVFYGHSEAIHIETTEKLTRAQALQLLRDAPGVEVLDDAEDVPTAVRDATNQDPVYVGRVREDLSHPLGLDLWVVSDNVRKGAALNAIQIAEAILDLI